MTGTTQRIDVWLWYARFFKSRTLATKACAGGKISLGDTTVSKPKVLVVPGDVLSFTQGDTLKVVKILALGSRRGPAPEAQSLYEDQSPPPPTKADAKFSGAPAQRLPGQGRPTKAERRATDKLKDFDDL